MVNLIYKTLERVNKQKEMLTEVIASGANVHSFDAYQRLVGKHEGLSEALMIIEEILSEDEEE